MSEPLILQLKNRIKELENKSAISIYNDTKQNMGNGLNEISFPDTDFKTGSALEKSENSILVKKAGLVVISFKIMLYSGFDENQNIQIQLLYGDKSQFFCTRPSSTSPVHISGYALFNAKINDKISIKFRNYNSKEVEISDTNYEYGNRLNVFYL